MSLIILCGVADSWMRCTLDRVASLSHVETNMKLCKPACLWTVGGSCITWRTDTVSSVPSSSPKSSKTDIGLVMEWRTLFWDQGAVRCHYSWHSTLSIIFWPNLIFIDFDEMVLLCKRSRMKSTKDKPGSRLYGSASILAHPQLVLL